MTFYQTFEYCFTTASPSIKKRKLGKILKNIDRNGILFCRLDQNAHGGVVFTL